MNGNAVEHLNLDSSSENEPFDGVERVNLGAANSNLGQVPADRWRRPADATPAVQNPSPLENAADRPHGRYMCASLSEHARADGVRPGITQVARAEVFTHSENDRFGSEARPIEGLRRTRRPITPLHPIRPLSRCTCNPSLDRVQTDMELARNGTHRLTAADGLNHQPTSLLDRSFKCTSFSLFSSAYRSAAHPPGHRAMEADRLWKARQETAAFPQPLENATPFHHPRFPQLPQPPLATQESSVSNQLKRTLLLNQLTPGCWHLSDPRLLAVPR